MNKSYIPASDSEFSVWATAFTATVKAAPTTYDISTAQLTEIENELAAFEAEYHESVQSRDASRAATANKMQARQALETTLRTVGSMIQANPEISDAEKAEAGLPIHSTSRRRIPAPTVAPAAEIEFAAPMRHTVHFFDAANRRRKTKPAGVKFCEIIMFVGDAEPESLELFRNVGVTSKPNYTISFDSIDVGKTAWYRFRWTNPRGEAGPWSTAYYGTVAE